jgi:hypothetical protein
VYWGRHPVSNIAVSGRPPADYGGDPTRESLPFDVPHEPPIEAATSDAMGSRFHRSVRAWVLGHSPPQQPRSRDAIRRGQPATQRVEGLGPAPVESWPEASHQNSRRGQKSFNYDL